jgi:hypothetical protein
MTEQLVSQALIDERLSNLSGEALQPGDPGYDDARMLWNGLFDKRPAVIVRCANADDVVLAVNFAREQGLEAAVKGGGHSPAGNSSCDDGVMIDLTPMKGIEIDPEARTVKAQPGLTWAEFDAATQEHGLAVTGGRFSTTGISGLMLGSGSGWLERKCGLTGDNLIAAEMVTADGRLVRASQDENPDLFWGLRGGSGNFGIVTSFELRLHEVGPVVYGGLMACMPERAVEILTFMRDYMADAPDDLGAGVAFVSAPPEPFVPEEMHFKPIVGVVICWTGSPEEGERVVAPIREVAQPVMDMVGPMPYTALQSMLDGGGPYGTRAYMKAEFFDGDMSDEAIEKLAKHGAKRAGPMAQLLLEPLGGAIRRVGEDDTALGRRDVKWCFHALALWLESDEASEAAHKSWARGLSEDMQPHTMPGVYLNFVGDEGEERVRSTYGPEKYARLQALKDKYDPTNFFHLNQNIKPSG